MKGILKKSVSLLFALAIVISCFAIGVLPAQAKKTMESHKTPKHISIVFDDSGSMVNGEKTPYNKNPKNIMCWSQAKYSLEAFTAMLDTNDELDIYGLNQGHFGNTIHGKDKEGAVGNIHESLKTGDNLAGTPVGQVKKAGKDLISNPKYSNKEKWLVVITDGAFENFNEKKTESLLSEFGSKLDNHVIFIYIGTKYHYTENNYTYYPAKDGEAILDAVEKAVTQIYSSSRNPVSIDANAVKKADNGEYYITVRTKSDVSASQFIVFAQGPDGADVKKTDNDDSEINKIPVKYTNPEKAVKYDGSSSSFKGTKNVIRTDKKLNGVIATILPTDKAIDTKANGGLRISFGKTKPKRVSVYYEPYVGITYSLKKPADKAKGNSDDKQSNVLFDQDTTIKPCVSPGEYTFYADVVDGISGESIKPELNPEMTVSFKGTSYTLDQLRNGIKLNLAKPGFDEGDVSAEASISIQNNEYTNKYSVNADDLVKMFTDMIVKETYRLKVDFKMPTARTLNYRFRKTNFLLGSLGKLTTKDKKHCIMGVVSCVDPKGNQVKLTQEQWKDIMSAYGAGEESKNSCIIGTPGWDDKTKVRYTQPEFVEQLQDGKGVFYIAPQYYRSEKHPDKDDKKHTTHTNLIRKVSGKAKKSGFELLKLEKHLCNISCEISLPDATPELAYSTIPTPPIEKSRIYEISISMWVTIGLIIFIIWMLGYILKGHLPNPILNKRFSKGLVENTASKENFSGNLTDPNEWKKADRDKEGRMKLKRTWWTVLVPYVPQQGKLGIGTNRFNNGLRLKVRSTSLMASEFAIINSANNFASFKKSSTMNDPGIIFKKGTAITKENLKKAKKEFRLFAYLKRYPKQLLVRCNAASFVYGGYKDEQYKMYKATLGKKPSKVKKAGKKSKSKKTSNSKKRRR